jgi:hypothetical protein
METTETTCLVDLESSTSLDCSLFNVTGTTVDPGEEEDDDDVGEKEEEEDDEDEEEKEKDEEAADIVASGDEEGIITCMGFIAVLKLCTLGSGIKIAVVYVGVCGKLTIGVENKVSLFLMLLLLLFMMV